MRISSVTQSKADLLWNEPECESRNGKITGYGYELHSVEPWSKNTSDVSTVQRATFDNLVPYTNYRARVRAQNSRGYGPFSEWVPFRTGPAGTSSDLSMSTN